MSHRYFVKICNVGKTAEQEIVAKLPFARHRVCRGQSFASKYEDRVQTPEVAMSEALPASVRYVKNGVGGQWWKSAKANGQIHLGWRSIPDALLLAADISSIEKQIRAEFGKKAGATQDFNALRTLLVDPNQHIWITFQDGCMWWCTVRNGIETNPDIEPSEKGHFWLTCVLPWSNQSIENRRHLVLSELPGIVTAVAGYQATVCEPKGWKEILRIIRNEEDKDAQVAALARSVYEDAVCALIRRLGPKDFEVLIDLILARTGWARLARLGGATEGIDVEVENVSSEEIAFVQVKSAATQSVLDDYVARFNARRDRYHRMIFAVHSPKGVLKAPAGNLVMVWTGKEIARRVVKLGLGDWVATRL
jgi:hypothetical protein